MKLLRAYIFLFLICIGCNKPPSSTCSTTTSLRGNLNGLVFLSSDSVSPQLSKKLLYGGLIEGIRRSNNEKFLCQALISPESLINTQESDPLTVKVYTSRKCLKPLNGDTISLHFYLYSDNSAATPSLQKAGYLPTNFVSQDLTELSNLRTEMKTNNLGAALRYIEDFTDHYVIHSVLHSQNNTDFNELFYKTACAQGVNFSKDNADFPRVKELFSNLKDNYNRHLHCYNPFDLTMIRGQVTFDATRFELLNKRGKAFYVDSDQSFQNWEAHLDQKFQSFDLSILNDFRASANPGQNAPHLYETNPPDWPSLKDYATKFTELWDRNNTPLVPIPTDDNQKIKPNDFIYVFSNSSSQAESRENHGYEVLSMVQNKNNALDNKFAMAHLQAPIGYFLAAKAGLAVVYDRNPLKAAEDGNKPNVSSLYDGSILMLHNQPIAILSSVHMNALQPFDSWPSIVHIHDNLSTTSDSESSTPTDTQSDTQLPTDTQQPEENPPARTQPEERPPVRTQPEERPPARTQPEGRPPARTQPEGRPPARTQPEGRPPARTQPVSRQPARSPQQSFGGWTYVRPAISVPSYHSTVQVDQDGKVYSTDMTKDGEQIGGTKSINIPYTQTTTNQVQTTPNRQGTVGGLDAKAGNVCPTN